MSHESENENDVVAEAAGYATGAASDKEKARVEAGLGESKELRNEVTEMTEVTALLGSAVEPVTPSAALKQSILAQIAVTPQLPPLIGSARAALADSEAGDGGSERVRGTPGTSRAGVGEVRVGEGEPGPTPVPWFRRPVTLVAAAAAAAALFVGGIAIGGVINQAPDSVSASEQFAAITTAPDAQRISTEVAGGGELELIASAELQSSAMVATGFSALPSESTYQLWYIGEGGPISAGTFDVADGSAWKVLDGSYAPGVTVGVTVEPKGGSEQPTTDPIAAVVTA